MSNSEELIKVNESLQKINDFYKSGYEEYKEKYEKQKEYTEKLTFFYSCSDTTESLYYKDCRIRDLYTCKLKLDNIIDVIKDNKDDISKKVMEIINE